MVGGFRHDQSRSIGAVALLIAGLGTAIWTTHATENAQDSAQRAALEQQRTSFQQQRALADRDELRGLLDEAAAALDAAMTQLDRMYVAWRTQPGRHEYPRKLVAAFARSKNVELRLVIRLSPNSDVLKNYDGVEDNIKRAATSILTASPFPQGVVPKVDSLRERALDYQDAFSDAARRLLSPR